MKKFLTAALLILGGSLYAQTTITCDSILQTSTCAGGNVIIAFQTTGTFPFGNVWTAELSDNWGNWTNPVSIGSTMFVLSGNGIIFGTIPANANFGFLYRVRITSTNPVDTSNDSPNTLIVTQVAQLNQIVANPSDSACPGDTITLVAINPASSYQWSTGDTSASIMVTQSGTYSVTTTDFLTCQSTAHDTVVFDAAFCTGIAEEQMQAALKVYPSPAKDLLNIQFEYSHSDDAYFELVDVLGNTAITAQLNSNSSATNQVDVSSLTAGIYLLSVHVDGKVVSTRVVIQ